MSSGTWDVDDEPTASTVIEAYLERRPVTAVCDPCIATALGLPLAAVARAAARLIERGRFTGWIGSCPRCSEVRPVIRCLAALGRGAPPAHSRLRLPPLR